MAPGKKSFLALGIGSDSVRGLGISADGLQIKTELHTESGASLEENIINVIDIIETKLGAKFCEAYITGNFGLVKTTFGKNTLCFPKIKKIENTDVYNAIYNSRSLENMDGKVLHLVPLQFLIGGGFDARNTDNAMGSSLAVSFNCIAYPDEIITRTKRRLLSSGIKPIGFYDPMYILGQRYHAAKKTEIFIEFGKTKTSVGVSRDRGLESRYDISIGQDDITTRLSLEYDLTAEIAEKIKLCALSTPPTSSDHYISVLPEFSSVTRFDVWNIWTDVNSEIISQIEAKTKIESGNIYISGTGTNPENIKSLILADKELEQITILDEYAAVGALAKLFFKIPIIKKRAAKTGARTIPIIPSMMCWDTGNKYIYDMFESVGIKRLHCDIMDGFYTEKILGSLEDLKKIRQMTDIPIQVHLMVEDPFVWIGEVSRLGGDTIILSSDTRRTAESLEKIKSLGKRTGMALHPDFDLRKLSLKTISMLDEIIVMSVKPGASGQKFMPEMLKKIRVLFNTRKQYGLKYKIIADGGIDEESSQMCWKNGCDLLISGSYLKNATDFREALRKLLPRRNC